MNKKLLILLTVSYSFCAYSLENLIEDWSMFTTCQVDQGPTQSLDPKSGIRWLTYLPEGGFHRNALKPIGKLYVIG